jgi:hypothetical protein
MRFFGGVSAKSQRAIEQLESLHEEMKVLRASPSPYGQVNTVDPVGGHYTFRLHPAWGPDTAARWAVIIGEIVHDLRSALDHLAWNTVKLSGGQPDRGHAFPLRTTEPVEGFGAWSTAPPHAGKDRHGKLFGASPEAIALIEAYQPYRGGRVGEVLGQLDLLWNRDKHQMLVPIALVTAPPHLELRGCELLSREERMEDGVLIVKVEVAPTSAEPKVEIRPDAPFDIGYEGRPLIDDLLSAAQLLVEMQYRFEELFPDEEDLVHREARAALRQSIGLAADK